MGKEIEKRERKNQPSGYYGNNHSNDLIIEYYCEKHDYLFFPESWTNDKTHWHYEKGYYDENGKLYSNLILSENGVYKGDLRCSKCKALNKNILWSEEAVPSCRECGDSFIDELERLPSDKVLKKVETNNPEKQKKEKTLKLIGIIAVLVIIVAFSLVLLESFGVISLPGLKKPIKSDSVYVQELGRNCNYVSQIKCFYDPETDCFFKGYKVKGVEEWEYWYYDISSKYGKYGWMKYDKDAKRWMIEVGNNDWEPLSEGKESDKLWHIK